jgi:hypothetical protein
MVDTKCAASFWLMRFWHSERKWLLTSSLQYIACKKLTGNLGIMQQEEKWNGSSWLRPTQELYYNDNKRWPSNQSIKTTNILFYQQEIRNKFQFSACGVIDTACTIFALENRSYLGEFEEEFKKALACESGAQGVLFDEKTRGSKISWHCPFNGTCKAL